MTHPLLLRQRLAHTVQRWITLGRLVISIGAFALGLYSFYLQDHPATLSAWFNTFFVTLGLLTLQFPHEIKDAVWQLNLARFLLPLFALFGTIHFVTGNALRPIRHALLGVFDRPVLLSLGPAIAAGGGGVGASLLRQLATLRISRAATGLDIPAALTALLDRDGVPILAADPAEPETWRRLRADHARLIVVAHGDDLANLNAAAITKVLRESNHQPQPGLLVLIERTEIADQVEIALDVARGDRAITWRRLSYIDYAVRPLFLDPVLTRAEQHPGHIVVLGYGPPGRAALRQALTLMQYRTGAGPAITIFGDLAATAADPLLAPGHVPAFVADLRTLAWDGATTLPPTLWTELEGRPTPNLWCVCRDDEPGLVTALALGETLATATTTAGAPLPGADAPIAVHQARLNTFLQGLAGTGGPLARLRPFGGILPDGAVQRILDDQDDALPRAMHVAYLAGLERQAATTGSRVPWDALTETLRHANRAAAAHLPVKLAAIGCRTTRDPLPATEPAFAFSEAEIAALMRIEHRRWCADRIVQGWRYAATTNRALRLHANLVDFNTLDPEAQQKDRNAITDLPDLLGGVGQRITRISP